MAIRAALQHLLTSYDHPIRDPLWHHVRLSDPLLRVIQLPAFQQLRGIKQLGPAYLVFPGATHTRFGHSLGVFHVAHQMLIRLLEVSPEWRPTVEEVDAFLCAALVHDVGHYPFAHSLKDLAVTPHESLTAEWVLTSEVAGTIRERVGADPELVAAIVDEQRPAPAGSDAGLFRAMLSGVVDPDKLDYLNRDAYFCGVPYGVQDTDYLLGELRLHAGGVAVSAAGLPAVESILFARYLMYRTVYWHKTMRVATAMIKKAVLIGLAQGHLQCAELYGLDDEGFRRLLEGRRSAFSLARRVFRGELLRVACQVPFDPALPAHRALQPPAARAPVEARLAADLSRACGLAVAAADVILDLPEPISFDVDLAVVDSVDTRAASPEVRGARARMESATVFNSSVVAVFRHRLRAISLITPHHPALLRAAAGLGSELLGGARRHGSTGSG